MTTLELKCNIDGIDNYYSARTNHDTDSGVDLYTTGDIDIYPGETKIIDLGVSSRMIRGDGGDTMGYYIYPRSSISKTPLVLANSVGIIDKDYRGPLKIALKYIPTKEVLEYVKDPGGNNSNSLNEFVYTIVKGTRLVQICSPDLKPVILKIVNSLDSTARGDGGFGSTGV